EYALLIVLIPKAGTFFEIIALISCVLAIPSGMVSSVTLGDEDLKTYNDRAQVILKWSAVVFIISLPLAVIWPSKSDLVTIIGGGVTYEIVNSEQAKEIGELSLEFVKRKLKEDEVTQ